MDPTPPPSHQAPHEKELSHLGTYGAFAQLPSSLLEGSGVTSGMAAKQFESAKLREQVTASLNELCIQP